jgi:hypothetical protein
VQAGKIVRRSGRIALFADARPDENAGHQQTSKQGQVGLDTVHVRPSNVVIGVMYRVGKHINGRFEGQLISFTTNQGMDVSQLRSAKIENS